jgi:beta-glucosidase
MTPVYAGCGMNRDAVTEFRKAKQVMRTGFFLLAALIGWSAGVRADGVPASSLRPTTKAFAGYSDKALERTRERLAARGDRCDLIFIGDSITDFFESKNQTPRLEIWNKYYGHRYALNFGHQGDGTQAVLWRLENMAVTNYSPKAGVLKIGTNNCGKYEPEDIAAGIRAVLDKMRGFWPDMKIILVSITPRAVDGDPDSLNAKPAAVNAIIRNFADDESVFFFDLYSLMIPEKNEKGADSYKGLSNDKLHFSTEGYQLWAENMEPLLARLLGDTPVTPRNNP